MSTTVLSSRCHGRRQSERLLQDGFRRFLATHAPQKPRLAVAVLLNRAPIITRTPTKFEQAFYKYQASIQRALHNPFPYDFYFKPGSILEQQFNKEERLRERKAFGKDFVSEDKSSGIEIESSEEEEMPMPRRTPADASNDVKSLDRQGARNLYLLIKGSPADRYEWRFPKGYLEMGELLHEAAQSRLTAQCGANINSWIVGRKPIGFFEEDDPANALMKEKIFFFKGHILAGQVQAQNNGLRDFAWLTKEEIEPRVAQEYWLATKDMLSDF